MKDKFSEFDPKIDALTGDIIGLLPVGIYKGVITEMAEPKESKSQEYHYIQIQVNVRGQTLYTYAAGYLPLMKMIYAKRTAFLHDEVAVKITHESFMGRLWNRAFILWDELLPKD